MAHAGYVAGIDLGGTKIAVVVVDRSAREIGWKVVPTMPQEGRRAVLNRAAQAVFDVLSENGIHRSELAGAGMGCPGPVDPVSGTVSLAPNLGWVDVQAGPEIQEMLGVPVALDNDANCAALAENKLGAGRGTRDMVFITVSTGIGGGIVAGGDVYRGFGFAAGEVGHITVVRDGPVCGCGNRGCLEAVASGTAIGKRGADLLRHGTATLIAELAGGDPERVDARMVAEAAEKGDEPARAVIRDAAEYIGIGLATIANLLNPEAFVIGGGVSAIGPALFDTIRRVVDERTLRANIKGVRIMPAALGSKAGAIGAALQGMEELSRLGR